METKTYAFAIVLALAGLVSLGLAAVLDRPRVQDIAQAAGFAPPPTAEAVTS